MRLNLEQFIDTTPTIEEYESAKSFGQSKSAENRPQKPFWEIGRAIAPHSDQLRQSTDPA
jgi:hypothetical protein